MATGGENRSTGKTACGEKRGQAHDGVHRDADIVSAIPHRPPFLLIDSITLRTETEIRASAVLRRDDELWMRIYAGHYPGNPITPGVLLLEMVFQAAAVLASDIVKREGMEGVPMVTRIQGAKFRKPVYPGEEVEARAQLLERMANAFYMKGGIFRNGAKAAEVEFAVALAVPEE